MLQTRSVAHPPDEIDLYEVLEISHSAGKDEIRKAYRKLVLKHHPDKVSEEDRPAADARFKAISQAYEILFDEDKREAYDTHGMAAFDPSRSGGMGGGGMDMEDLLAHMFGMGGGMPGGGAGRGHKRSRKGEDEVQKYDVTLEDLYRGKTVKFSSTKNVICSHCKGKGGREGGKAKTCDTCKGSGTKEVLVPAGPFVTQQTVTCSTCRGEGSIWREKDKCKKCKGAKTTKEKKPLELYIPRGSQAGDKIVLAGEADQRPEQEPGDIVFVLTEKEHAVFRRDGVDLSANISVSLAEALTGFSRPVIKHLDDRALSITQPAGSILRPLQVLKIAGEGMPHKRSDARGDLYLIVEVKFPEDTWAQEGVLQRLKALLPEEQLGKDIQAETVDEVDFDPSADIEDFGTEGGRTGGGWVDDEDEEDDEEGGANAQCAQQ